ncbi:MAG: dihydrofolate reductase family protein [Pseudoclavibacter sp.]|nr:dihydrofolate reductase family protein [Pseudoclavibacter sp.]
MTRFVYSTAVSVDGRIADEHHSLDWLFAIETAGAELPDPLAAAGALVMGAGTYRWLVEHEALLSRPERWREFFGERPVFLFTSGQPEPPAGAELRVRRDVSAALAEIRAAARGRDVWIVGGGDLAGQFADAGALDLVELQIAPVALGAGPAVLPRRIDPGRLRLVEARAAGAFALLRYELDAGRQGPSGR